MNRREALGILAGATLLGGCSRLVGEVDKRSKQPLDPPTKSDNPYVACLNRFGFGPTNGQIEEIEKSDLDSWFESQLSPNDQEPRRLTAQIEGMEIFHLGPYDLRDWNEEAIIGQLQQAAILRATYSPWQVRERMVDFWSNHFNIYARKGLGAYRKPMDERLVIRDHVFGKFSDMVHASSKSTAMLLYLDQQNSNYANPNENYARELLELHTLGVHGGYSQEDVMEVARCFTGWTEERRFMRKKGDFHFRPELHDVGEKKVLGQTIPAGQGVEDGEQVVEIVALHKHTAKHLATKLCRYYLGHTKQETVDRLAQEFLINEGNIRKCMLFLYQEFKDGNTEPIIKRPFDYVVSSLRALDATTDGKEVGSSLEKMGQPLYLWPMPDGYPQDLDAWKSSLLSRWNFALELVGDDIQGTTVNLEVLTKNLDKNSQISTGFYLPKESSLVGRVVNHAQPHDLQQKIALALCSQEFQWK